MKKEHKTVCVTIECQGDLTKVEELERKGWSVRSVSGNKYILVKK